MQFLTMALDFHTQNPTVAHPLKQFHHQPLAPESKAPTELTKPSRLFESADLVTQVQGHHQQDQKRQQQQTQPQHSIALDQDSLVNVMHHFRVHPATCLLLELVSHTGRRDGLMDKTLDFEPRKSGLESWLGQFYLVI